jgi:predicted nucleic acid-binding protein
MKVISDTSPLCYLVLIGCDEVLPKFYQSIATTQTVINELRHIDAPDVVRRWAEHSPGWLSVYPDSEPHDPALNALHAGERSVISLAEKLHADVLLLDELAARKLAMKRGHKVAGLLGLLVEAADAGFLDLDTALSRLRQTNFRASPALLRSLLSRRS